MVGCTHGDQFTGTVAQVGFAEDDDVVEAVAAKRAHEALHEWIPPRRLRRGLDLFDAKPGYAVAERDSVDAIAAVRRKGAQGSEEGDEHGEHGEILPRFHGPLPLIVMPTSVPDTIVARHSRHAA